MAVLLGILVPANILVAVLISWVMNLRALWHFLVLAIAQYLVSDVIAALVLTGGDLEHFPAMAFIGLIFMAIPAAPFMLVTVLTLWLFRRKRG